MMAAPSPRSVLLRSWRSLRTLSRSAPHHPSYKRLLSSSRFFFSLALYTRLTSPLAHTYRPVPEAEFRHILEYTERQRFKFKLSRWQCRDLLETMCAYDAKLRTKRLLSELSFLSQDGPS